MTKQEHNKGLDEFRVSELRFLGEQAGPSEDVLKDKLARLLRTTSGIKSAFLARVDYGIGTDVEVALCILSQTASEVVLVEHVHRVFADVFGSEVHLDIIFLNQEQELQISSVCAPFFESKDELDDCVGEE